MVQSVLLFTRCLPGTSLLTSAYLQASLFLNPGALEHILMYSNIGLQGRSCVSFRFFLDKVDTGHFTSFVTDPDLIGS